MLPSPEKLAGFKMYPVNFEKVLGRGGTLNRLGAWAEPSWAFVGITGLVDSLAGLQSN